MRTWELDAVSRVDCKLNDGSNENTCGVSLDAPQEELIDGPGLDEKASASTCARNAESEKSNTKVALVAVPSGISISTSHVTRLPRVTLSCPSVALSESTLADRARSRMRSIGWAVGLANRL